MVGSGLAIILRVKGSGVVRCISCVLLVLFFRPFSSTF